MSEDFDTSVLTPKHIRELIAGEESTAPTQPLSLIEKRRLLQRGPQMREAEQKTNLNEKSLDPIEDTQIRERTESYLKYFRQGIIPRITDTSFNDLNEIETFPAIHFGNIMTKSGRELQRVNTLYDLLLKKLMSDEESQDETSTSNFDYKKTVNNQDEHLQIFFIKKGQHPNTLFLTYEVPTAQSEIKQRYLFTINSKEIFMNTMKLKDVYNTNPVNPNLWETRLDSTTEELNNKQRYSLHMLEKATKLYLTPSPNPPPNLPV